MTELSQQQHDLAEIQEHIDEYGQSRAATREDPVEWYMKCHAELDVDKAAVQARFVKHHAILDEAERGLLGDLDRRRQGLDWKHREEVLQIVAERLRGKKARHIKTDHGKVGFRKKPATTSLNVFDEAAVMANCPEFVKVEKKLDKAALKKRLESTGRMGSMAWLEETPEQDVFYVDTGKKELPPAQPQAALPEKGSE